MHYEIKPNVPGQWYIHVKDNYTAPPVALFYDLDAAKVFVAAHSAEPKGLTNEERKQIDNALDMLLCAMRAANWGGDAAYSAGEKARALLSKGE